MARQRKKAEVTVSFQVTFQLPQGMSIPTARQYIKDALFHQTELGIINTAEVKVHLTNKEIKYA